MGAKKKVGRPNIDPNRISLRLLPSGPDRVHEQCAQHRSSACTIAVHRKGQSIKSKLVNGEKTNLNNFLARTLELIFTRITASAARICADFNAVWGIRIYICRWTIKKLMPSWHYLWDIWLRQLPLIRGS